MHRRVLRSFMLMLHLCGLTGCASTHSGLLRERLDPAQHLAYVKDGHTLCLTDGQGNHTQELLTLETGIISPAWSPDGNHIAFFTYEKSFGLLSHKSKARLMVYDTIRQDSRAYEEFQFQVEYEGPEGINLVVAPLRWTQDSKTLVIADKNGIHRIRLNDDHEERNRGKEPDSPIVFSDGVNLIHLDGNDAVLSTPTARRTLAPPIVRLLADKETRTIAFSADGTHVALSQWDRLIVVDLTTQQSTQIHKASDPIEWIAWFPHDNRLVYLSGRPTRRVGAISYRSIEYGYSSLFAISATGSDVVKLYTAPDLDVREASPDLSPDGRYVALIGKPLRDNQKVFIVATDRSGRTQLTRNGRCTYPAWRPTR